MNPSELYGAVGIRIRRFRLKKFNRPDVSFVSGNVWIGGTSNIRSIADCGIQNILDLRIEARDNPLDPDLHLVDYLNIGIRDGDPPTRDQAMQAVQWLRQKRSERTLIHCNLGRGRAPTVAILYMMYDGMTASDAIRTVRRSRRFTFLNRAQLDAIYDFEKMLNDSA